MNLNKWIRFCLLFIPAIRSVDWDKNSPNGYFTVIKIKYFRGKVYVMDAKQGKYYFDIDETINEPK